MEKSGSQPFLTSLSNPAGLCPPAVGLSDANSFCLTGNRAENLEQSRGDRKWGGRDWICKVLGLSIILQQLIGTVMIKVSQPVAVMITVKAYFVANYTEF